MRELLDRAADERPDAALVLFEDGTVWSCRELWTRVRTCAAGLQALGVEQDELVLSWLPNGPTAVTLFLALNYLGAVYVPINVGYRGELLAHVLANSGARLMVADGRLLERLIAVPTHALRSVVVIGAERALLPGLRLLEAGTLTSGGAAPREPQRPIAPWDLQMVIYTSGTTGPSKGVLASYLHTRASALGFSNVGPGDRNLMLLPMFHIGGPLALAWALLHGGSVVVAESFKTATFWDLVRRTQVTTTGLLGVMVQFLMQQPASGEDRAHALRSVVIAPFDEQAIAFGRRFGVDVYTEYNMTELSVPLFAGPNPSAAGVCGRARAGVELRLVDEHDMPVPEGATGELLVRAAEPWTLSHGYLNDPAATARAWRNGWFHTGDLFRRDAAGNYFFVDRSKDAVRRRGENISSFEVERALLKYPGVREAAVVPVPGDGSEEEVLAVVAPVPGRALVPRDLIQFVATLLAPFMVPRYVRVLDELPKTPTQKIEKHALRRAGLTPDTWDREAAGIAVHRDRLTGR